MKIIKKLLVLPLLALIVFTNNGCDELQTLPLNIPFDIEVTTTGSGTSSSNQTQFCLSSSEDYQNNIDKLKSAKFVAAAYTTLSVTPGLMGNITVSLYDATGSTLLFGISLPNVDPASYVGSPFKLELNETQITAINNIISLLGDQCFMVKLDINNITAGQTPYTLTGNIEIVIETEVEF